MSFSGTLSDRITKTLPNISDSDYFSIVFSGDIDQKYNGWCGVVLDQVYGGHKHFEAFFGNFSEKMLEWENMPKWMVKEDLTAPEVMLDLSVWLRAYSKRPVLISSNIDNWALPLLQEAVKAQPVCGFPKYTMLDVRRMYTGMTEGYNEQEFNATQKLYKLFPQSSLGVTFGVGKLFKQLSCDYSKLPKVGPNPLCRSKQLVQIADKLLSSDFESESSD